MMSKKNPFDWQLHSTFHTPWKVSALQTFIITHRHLTFHISAMLGQAEDISTVLNAWERLARQFHWNFEVLQVESEKVNFLSVWVHKLYTYLLYN